jgi:hypothetical protein
MYKTSIYILFLLISVSVYANTEKDQQASDAILLTVFLKHDQSMNLYEIKDHLKQQRFFETFPPEGVSVVSWYVMMGIGQVITLEVPAHKLRAVNLAIEKSAWKAFSTEFYATYNLYPVVKDKLSNKAKVNY